MQYSLIYRKPETNGVLEACKEAGVTLVAYSPLCQGLLTGGWVGGCLVWWWSVGEGVGCRVGGWLPGVVAECAGGCGVQGVRAAAWCGGSRGRVWGAGWGVQGVEFPPWPCPPFSALTVP